MAKILLCAEFTKLNTGYATYYRELAKAFTEAGHEVFEIAAFGDSSERSHVEYAQSAPWTIFLNIPDRNKDKQNFNNFKQAEEQNKEIIFGGWLYNRVMLEHKPDFVIGLRDYWYEKFIMNSPLSKYSTVILSPTVDSAPQKGEWLEGFNKADHIVCYNKWSEDWFRTQSINKKILPYISPGVDASFKPVDKKECRQIMNLPQDKKILGTIMRNQPRKLFPDLFKVIKELPDILLYCHTTYPDMGWELPELLAQYQVENKVYLTYKCEICPYITASLYKGRMIACPQCKSKLSHTTINSEVTTSDLNTIYNNFDLYVQYANSEGFGIPTSEASAAGVQTLTIDYAAQSDVGDKLNSIKLEPLTLQRDVDFNCYRAIPNNEILIEKLLDDKTWEYDRYEVSKLQAEHYSWDKTSNQWVELINNMKPKNKWNSDPLLMRNPVEYKNISNLPNDQFVIVCAKHVAQIPELVGSRFCAELLEVLNTGILHMKSDQGHKNESFVSVDKRFVYNQFLVKFKELKKWEDLRSQLK